MRSLANIWWLGLKELRSFTHDPVLMGLVLWAFTFAIYSQAQGNAQELHNASVAVLDEDRSILSRSLTEGLLPPNFPPPVENAAGEIDRAMDRGLYTFVIDIPPHFERDVAAGRQPAVQVQVDATAMMQAGVGAGYLEQIIQTEVTRYVAHLDQAPVPRVALVVHIAFNPNVTTAWFTSVMGIISHVTMLAIVLAGAALIREREHGTMDHLLVMPVTPFEIAMSKIWANALVITLAVAVSLYIVVRGLLGVPIAGSILLFLVGVVLYLFFATAIGLFLGTLARTMPQLGLLFMLVAVPLNMLSGENTPLESMPYFLRTLMQASPTTHFVSFAQAILYRGAGIGVVWPQFLAVAFIGGLFLVASIYRFRKVVAIAS
jgi:ABC-2 type transport system permease protein